MNDITSQTHAFARVPLTARLRALEAEAIHILRETEAEFARPILLYSVGKDSSVLLHLARKAFYPGRIRFLSCMSTRPGSFAR